MSDKKPRSASGIQKILQKAALLIWAVLIVILIINRHRISVDSITGFSPENLLLAALMFIALFALKTLSLVISSGILYAASGIVFGLPLAILINLIGTFTMLTEGYFIGRSAGSGLVTEFTVRYPKFRNFTALKDMNPYLFTILLRMIKVLNYDLGSLYMGASGVPLLPFYTGSFTALLPEMILFSMAGDGIGSRSAGPVVAAGILYAVSFLFSALMFRHLLRRRRPN